MLLGFFVNVMLSKTIMRLYLRSVGSMNDVLSKIFIIVVVGVVVV